METIKNAISRQFKQMNKEFTDFLLDHSRPSRMEFFLVDDENPDSLIDFYRFSLFRESDIKSDRVKYTLQLGKHFHGATVPRELVEDRILFQVLIRSAFKVVEMNAKPND